MNNSLNGIKVLDLTRVLAGPYCTQMLGDLGADIIKVERPGSGDDTRGFAPPFVKNENGDETDLSAYFCGANRNKKSITINLSTKEGQNLVKKLLSNCDILVENFILMNQENIPLTIICGNSQRMIDLVYEVIDSIGCQTVVMDQYGIIVIRVI